MTPRRGASLSSPPFSPARRCVPLGGGHLCQSEGARPHRAIVQRRLVAEPERCVPRVEVLGALKEADDLLVHGICRHPVPGSRRQTRRPGRIDGVEPLGERTIRCRYLGDLREQRVLPIRLSLFARASAFSSLARSFIAACSSAVNPLDPLSVIVVPLADIRGSPRSFVSWLVLLRDLAGTMSNRERYK
jgi:hypothetical protein